ncbi:MAG: hypothetical protein IKP64_01515 [Selenomonadaceae bacterium]|nr:hypothetical protein [Selenomonadaceae bacterium]MBR4382212.1 hypothetical protein [Selenomonadaceae bacterium]
MADTIAVNHSNCNVYSARGGDDLLIIANNNNTLRGDTGNDFFICDGTTNTLEGGDGNDVFICGGTTNIIEGGDGNDVFICGGTTNTLEGGDGNDVFICGGTNNIIEGGNGNDSVFSAEYQDTVQLYDVTIDDVRGCLYDANTKTILIGLNSGNDISVESNVNLWSAKFQLADGNTYRYNRMFDFWQKV